MNRILWATQPRVERNPQADGSHKIVKSAHMKLAMAIKRAQHKMPNKSANVIMQNKHFNMDARRVRTNERNAGRGRGCTLAELTY